MKPTAQDFYSEYRRLQKQRSRLLVRFLKAENRAKQKDTFSANEIIALGDLNGNMVETQELLSEIGAFFLDKYLQT